MKAEFFFSDKFAAAGDRGGTNKMKAAVSFSGGKDSILALERALKSCEVAGLVMTFKDGESWFHEISSAFCDKLSSSLGIPIVQIKTAGGAQYTEDFAAALVQLRESVGIEAIVFGDIDLLPHRSWCEELAERAGLVAVFPLWGEERAALVHSLIAKGYRAVIKKVDKKKLGKDQLGKLLDREFLDLLRSRGLDECGENGEYHSVVVDGPCFLHKVDYELGEIYEDDWSYIIRIT